MSAIKLQAFGGMIPAVDNRLLPDDASADAKNVWFYNGSIEGLRSPRLVFVPQPSTRTVFRVPKDAPGLNSIENSFWLEFDTLDINIVKSPLAESADPAFYWASVSDVPGYTTKSRLVAGDPPLVLGIPVPTTPPTVVASGGTGANVTRAYVYTWVSAYGEEGAPSEATIVTGKTDDTWAIGLTAPTVGDTTNRAITRARIYRTVTSSTGVASFYFVTEVPIATLSYNDTLADDAVINAGVLESTDWTPPPDNLEGLAALPNGMLCGWVGNEIWFCEPYRPHAWPAKYSLSIEYDIVAMVGAGQTLVIGTEAYPYFATGVSPANVTLQRIPVAEPCLSRSSMVGAQVGAYYGSPNGLIFVSAAGTANNITHSTIQKADWQSLLNLEVLRAALLNGAYFVYSGVTEAAFEPTAFENTAFQMFSDDGTRQGALIEFQDTRVGFSRLLAPQTVWNILQDPWTGEVLAVLGDGVYVFDLTNPDMQSYEWLSKIFTLAYPDNLGAIKITYEPPLGAAPAAGVLSVFADGKLRLTRAIPASNQVFKMPSGFKADTYQFSITGNLVVKSIQIASTVRELQTV